MSRRILIVDDEPRILLLLQSLHPRALAGVLQNSNFREDPWGRLIRTAKFYGASGDLIAQEMR